MGVVRERLAEWSTAGLRRLALINLSELLAQIESHFESDGDEDIERPSFFASLRVWTETELAEEIPDHGRNSEA